MTVYIPQTHNALGSGAYQCGLRYLRVFAKGQANHVTGAIQLLNQLAGGGLPHPHFAIIATTGQPRAICTRRAAKGNLDGTDRIAKPIVDEAAGGDIPHMHPAIIAAAGQQAAIRAERNRIDEAGVFA